MKSDHFSAPTHNPVKINTMCSNTNATVLRRSAVAPPLVAVVPKGHRLNGRSVVWCFDRSCDNLAPKRIA